ncbi:rh171 [macacine betaherpesvirus 3]|uniref:Rh171 n=1 Tax=Rhesus cytomegalovirus (strain 68-1) TaxID=47929 RepID=Q2FAD2_RHCM6|nr:rh171 [macacine betaherpesvirus 3]APT40225.1 Rh171 [macacine betaherpesvirus 3]QXV50512.1 protein O18 [macacine betaherpesvirus 3]
MDTATIVLLSIGIPAAIIFDILIILYRDRVCPYIWNFFSRLCTRFNCSLKKPDEETKRDASTGDEDETMCVCSLWCASLWAGFCQCVSRCVAFTGRCCSQISARNKLTKENLEFYFPCCFTCCHWLSAKLYPTEPPRSRRGQPKDKKQTEVEFVTVDLEGFECELPTLDESPRAQTHTGVAEADNAETQALIHKPPSKHSVSETPDTEEEATRTPTPDSVPDSVPEPDSDPEPCPAPAPTPEPNADIPAAAGVTPEVALLIQSAVEAAVKAALLNAPKS